MANELISWPSPAKLNLFLHITGRRPDGYHQLQSLFQLLDYGDTLRFEINTRTDIELVSLLPGVANEDNLIVRAARLLQHATGTNKGCRIHLDKRLPMGGGIGGGSSNAATTLVALNYLWQCGLSTDKLAELGLRLGADVPVFVHGKTAFASGVGETLTPAPQGEKTFLVVNPGIAISTAQIFNHQDLPRTTKPISWRDYDFDNTQNDCEKLVCNTHPQVANLLHWLLEYAPSRMTGTGSSLFAICDNQNQAENLLSQLPEGCHGFVATGVNQSPLQQMLDRLRNADQKI
ncbi:4-(cytidine 5'-diphospho)-2-C-methyl-D-erythritol kinase [Lacimicrobium alkaliphilum]|uniref:4-diphosphocytidyl-2-C-methyl-D-erythritol kinase n=1 Tax=Lacimicrobium alkaliphilum TaxID=1526571 RepID=A0ABQ1RA03_9ALTE|nr:4-(cytidine 5'-diphospho)-2-C-methyl-D-erythritol kinase [Lacimicrobium alkaliphilum]GGD63575.1 4-diphosphocytidyl-2-C-methyl-D-erythritol kinase [Lacimicrobium alkaliphilum]